MYHFKSKKGDFMLNKKQMLALMLSTSVSSTMVNADQFQDALQAMKKINVDQLKNALIQKAQELQPKIESFIAQVEQDNFNNIAAALAIDLTPAVTFLQNNMGTIKNAIREIVMQAANNTDQIPAQFRASVQAALAQAKNKLALMNNFDSYLATIKPYANLNEYKNTIATALQMAYRTAADSAEFAALKNSAGEFKEDLMPFINKISQVNAQALKNALEATEVLINNYTKNEDFDQAALQNVAKGFGQFRKNIAPAIPALLEGLSQIALRVNDIAANQGTANKLPAKAQEALEMLKNEAAMVKDTLIQLNAQINKAVAALK